MPLKLNGATSGSITLDVPAAAGNNTVVVPAIPGTFLIDQSDGGVVIDTSGNVGVGVTPSSFGTGLKAIEFNTAGNAIVGFGASDLELSAGAYYNAGYRRSGTSAASSYWLNAGAHYWLVAPSGTAGSAVTFTQAMTLTNSGQLVIGASAPISTEALSIVSSTYYIDCNYGGYRSFLVGAVDWEGFNSATIAAVYVGRNIASGRSINAGGTVNTSGADYAEYMVKAGTFTIAKGDVCGIDANGKLTNVFADAVTFVVKSTSPSYVGGDEWAAGITDPVALEAARQTVDRIAFAGRVPCNVTGSAVGDYIVPQANADGSIGGKPVAASAATLAEYMSAVGKVYSLNADGTCNIIVKVA